MHLMYNANYRPHQSTNADSKYSIRLAVAYAQSTSCNSGTTPYYRIDISSSRRMGLTAYRYIIYIYTYIHTYYIHTYIHTYMYVCMYVCMLGALLSARALPPSLLMVVVHS